MAVLAAAVCTRGGKVLLSRQFEQLSAERVQELFSNFPKLAQVGSQHTTVEDENVRYVYEPQEELYIVLVTDLHSNILQDIRTLRLVSQVVASYVQGGDEREVGQSAFELLGAFDEIVLLGYAEDLTLAQVETFLEMESHEEKIQEIIERNKELEAAEERKKRARELDQQRRAARSGASGLEPLGYQGDGTSSPFDRQAAFNTLAHDSPSGGLSNVPSTSNAGSVGASRYNERRGTARGGRGLKLGRSRGAAEEAAPLLAELEENTRSVGAEGANDKPTQSAAIRGSADIPSESTDVQILEEFTVEATREGTIKSSRVSGTLHVLAGDVAHNKLRIHTVTGGPANAYKTNPKMDRTLFSKEGILGLKNPNEAFIRSSVLLVKWTVDNVAVPITFNVWISETQDAGFLSVTLEYELASDFEGRLENVSVVIPLPTSNAHVLDPSSVYDQFDDHLIWMIPVADNGEGRSSGSFEFTAEGDSEEDFMPLEVSYMAKNLTKTFGDIDVQQVTDALDGSSVEFTKRVEAQVHNYLIR